MSKLDYEIYIPLPGDDNTQMPYFGEFIGE